MEVMKSPECNGRADGDSAGQRKSDHPAGAINLFFVRGNRERADVSASMKAGMTAKDVGPKHKKALLDRATRS